MPSSLGDLPTQDLVDELCRRLLTVEAAAMFLDTHVSYVWRLVSVGHLKTVKLFGRSLFERTALEVEHKRREKRKHRIAVNKASRSDVPEPGRPAYEAWNVRDLQRECKYRKLRVRGRKAELVKRLIEDDDRAASDD